MDTIESLREKYRGNPYMLTRLDQYLQHLPALLETTAAEYSAKLIKRSENSAKKTKFVQEFLALHQYYYVAQTDQYIHYDDSTYSLVTEDDVTHHIMMGMDKGLLGWKFKLRIHILKRIKDHPLQAACPDNVTLGRVTRLLYPSFFASKSYARYFLVVIGDALLGKRTLIYFMDKSFKTFMQLVNHGVGELLNKNFADDFKYKYYDHDFKACRILPGVCPENKVTKLNMADFAAVAMFLSNKYVSADHFLEQCSGCEFATKVMRLSLNTPTTLVRSFLDEYTLPGGTVHYKGMYFLWRTFLQRNTLPFVVSQVNFKHILTEMGIYDALTDQCSVGAKYAPSLINFQNFWERHITHHDPGDTYEVAELVELYNAWCESKTLHIAPQECLDWLQRESHPMGGAVKGIRCALWDKTVDIENALELFKHDVGLLQRPRKGVRVLRRAHAKAQQDVSYQSLFYGLH
jgi:hypothetical protein